MLPGPALGTMSEVKKVPKKLRGRDELLMVDPQIARWRQKLRKEGIVLGRNSAKAEKLNERQREERALPEPTKRKFF